MLGHPCYDYLIASEPIVCAPSNSLQLYKCINSRSQHNFSNIGNGNVWRCLYYLCAYVSRSTAGDARYSCNVYTVTDDFAFFLLNFHEKYYSYLTFGRQRCSNLRLCFLHQTQFGLVMQASQSYNPKHSDPLTGVWEATHVMQQMRSTKLWVSNNIVRGGFFFTWNTSFSLERCWAEVACRSSSSSLITYTECSYQYNEKFHTPIAEKKLDKNWNFKLFNYKKRMKVSHIFSWIPNQK